VNLLTSTGQTGELLAPTDRTLGSVSKALPQPRESEGRDAATDVRWRESMCC
jgi:hypothetical protein